MATTALSAPNGSVPPPRTGEPISKLRAIEPALLASRLRLPERHGTLLDLARSPSMLLETLVELDLVAEAARLLAHALPEREAVWWACMCACHTAPSEITGLEQRALHAAEQWVRRPGEETRRAAAVAGRVRAFRVPGLWAALAAAWAMPTSGSAAVSNAPLKPDACAAAVTAGVTLAAVRDAPRRRRDRLVRFVASGRDIAVGGAGRLPREADG